MPEGARLTGAPFWAESGQPEDALAVFDWSQGERLEFVQEFYRSSDEPLATARLQRAGRRLVVAFLERAPRWNAAIQIVKRLRLYFCYDRSLLGALCQTACVRFFSHA